MLNRTIFCAAATVLMLDAQPPVANRPFTASDQPDAQTLSRTVQALRRGAQLTGAAASEADKLLEEAASLMRGNQSGEGRRRLAHAQAIMTGKAWDAREEFVWSLVLRPQRFAVEQSSPVIVELAQLYATAYQAAGILRLRLALKTSGRESKVSRQLGLFEVPARDLVAEPFRLAADLTGTPDGSYQLTAELAARRRLFAAHYAAGYRGGRGNRVAPRRIRAAPGYDPGPRERQSHGPLAIRYGACREHGDSQAGDHRFRTPRIRNSHV
jgi:hypothetical protein